VPGYPIRTSSDHSSVDSSPRPIAASHVLHRLLMPRHPPCALDNLTNTHIKKSRHNKTLQKQKMLASTVQFSTTTRTTNPPTTPAAGRSNDRTPEKTHPSPRNPPTTASGSRRARGPGRPLRTQQCVLNPPETGGSMRSVFPHFLEQPLHAGHPHPGTSPGTTGGAKLSGPSTTTHRCTEHTSMDTGRAAVFGEAP
jgi:hypothetical protein